MYVHYEKKKRYAENVEETSRLAVVEIPDYMNYQVKYRTINLFSCVCYATSRIGGTKMKTPGPPVHYPWQIVCLLPFKRE